MNEDILKGKWKQMKGDVQKKWGKLTDDDIEEAAETLTLTLALLPGFGL